MQLVTDEPRPARHQVFFATHFLDARAVSPTSLLLQHPVSKLEPGLAQPLPSLPVPPVSSSVRAEALVLFA